MIRPVDHPTVASAVSDLLVTLDPSTKLEQAARLFEEFDVNAAPVVDAVGKCVGILTSSDVVRYESIRGPFNRQFWHGIAFDLRSRGDKDSLGMSGRPFDEVAYHMSTEIKTVSGDATLECAGRLMFREQIQHLMVLDDCGRPIGILTALDILGKTFEEPPETLDDAAALVDALRIRDELP